MLSYKSVVLAFFVSFVTAVYIDAAGALVRASGLAHMTPTMAPPPVEHSISPEGRIEPMNALFDHLHRIKATAVETQNWEPLHGAFRLEPGSNEKDVVENIVNLVKNGKTSDVVTLNPHPTAIQITKAIRNLLADEKVGVLVKLEPGTAELAEFEKLVAMKQELTPLERKVKEDSIQSSIRDENGYKKPDSSIILEKMKAKYDEVVRQTGTTAHSIAMKKDLNELSKKITEKQDLSLKLEKMKETYDELLLKTGTKWIERLPKERKAEFQHLQKNVRKFLDGIDVKNAKTGIEHFAVSTTPSQVKFEAGKRVFPIDMTVSKDLIAALYAPPRPKIENKDASPQEKAISSSSSSRIDRLIDDSSLDLTRKNSFSSSSSSGDSRSDDSSIDQEGPSR